MTGTTGTTRTFEKSIDNRKHLVERIAAISGQEIVYTRAPRYAYEIGVFSVERDGKLVVTINADNADNANAAAESVGRVIAVLKAEGSIGEEIITSTQTSSSSEATETAEAAEPAETAEVAEVAEAVNVADEAAVDEAASELPNQPAMETAEASAVMEAITDETTEHQHVASEEASEEADAEEPDTESINTPEISSIANMAEAAKDNVINTAEIDSTDSTDSDNGIAFDHCGENCLLGTEDWDDEEDSSDEAQIE